MVQFATIKETYSRFLAIYTRFLRTLVMLLTAIAALGVITMLVITCLDVVLRLFRNPIVGTLDIVKVAGVITIAAALPYTTAIKGHVAIEYFFHKLSRTGRIIVDSFSRLLGLALFASLTWQSIQYAASLKHSGEVTPTLQIPIFWIPYVIAFSCAIVCLVVLYNLLHPGKEMIKP